MTAKRISDSDSGDVVLIFLRNESVLTVLRVILEKGAARKFIYTASHDYVVDPDRVAPPV